jgi:hypothetical protein
MRTIIKTMMAAAALFGAGTMSANAGELGAPLYKMMDACHEEYSRFCPSVQQGDGGRLVQCLSTFKSELSPRCERAFNVASAMRACEADYHRLCQGVPPGRGEAVRCLEENGRDVSEFCRRSIQGVIPEFGHRRLANGYRDEGFRGEHSGYYYGERDRRYGPDERNGGPGYDAAGRDDDRDGPRDEDRRAYEDDGHRGPPVADQRPGDDQSLK